jgi:nucleotide-binding universal stress UspA family protein
MYKHILIPTDGSETADKAVEAGIEFAREAGARVTLFTALPEYQMPSEAQLMARQPVVSVDEYQRLSQQDATAIFDKPLAKARAAGVACDTDYALHDRPHEAIVESAKRNGCDAIFMATHARTGLSALWHGSETHEVLTHSAIPTLVYR